MVALRQGIIGNLFIGEFVGKILNRNILNLIHEIFY